MPTRVARSRQFLQANRRNVSPSLASLNAFEMQRSTEGRLSFVRRKRILLPVLLFLSDAGQGREHEIRTVECT